MRRMIPGEIANHISREHLSIATDLEIRTPRIELTHPVVSGLSSNYNMSFLAAMDDEEGDYCVEVQLTDEGIRIDPDYNVTGKRYLKIINLPTSDPQVEGALWNDNGTLKISAGE